MRTHHRNTTSRRNEAVNAPIAHPESNRSNANFWKAESKPRRHSLAGGCSTCPSSSTFVLIASTQTQHVAPESVDLSVQLGIGFVSTSSVSLSISDFSASSATCISCSMSRGFRILRISVSP
ncbi:hypothetical protein M758_5G014500 [Ceratodon purpureus]|nr:hypothetical protein M758_5G014500 [Ceratodon purpureus]